MQERLRVLRDDGMWLAGKPDHNGDWPWYPLVRVEFTESWGDRDAKNPLPRYWVGLYAASPEAADADNLAAAIECCGGEPGMDPQEQALTLAEYGTAAVLWQETGNNLRTLLRQARSELVLRRSLFGFYMDNPQNAIGNTGWDWISGNIGFPARKEA